MSGPVVDEAVMHHAQEVMVAARRAEHAVLCEVARLERTATAEHAGYRSTERLVQDLWRIDRGEARRLVGHARALCAQVSPSGAVLEPRLAATAPESAAGMLDRGHVRVIDEAVRYLERVDGIDPVAIGEAEEFLAEKAGVLAPRGLAKVAAQFISALDPDGVAPDEEPEPTDELRVGRRRDGSLALRGRFTGRADIALILAAFDALSGRAGPEDERTLEARYAATLLELCGLAMGPGGIGANVEPKDRANPSETTAPPERGDGDPANLAAHQRHPDDRTRQDDYERLAEDTGSQDTGSEGTGSEGTGSQDAAGADEPAAGSQGAGGQVPPALARPRVPGRALVTVTMPFSWLRGGIGHALIGSDEAISPAQARRLACDAAIVPMVLGTRSEPLDVGRLSYKVPEGIRRALVVRDQGCAFPGCTRRPERCDAHHIDHWADGGRTCLANCCLLCPFHHQLVHHSGWDVVMREGRPWFVPPAWLDPQRQPRPGGPGMF